MGWQTDKLCGKSACQLTYRHVSQAVRRQAQRGKEESTLPPHAAPRHLVILHTRASSSFSLLLSSL